MGEILTLSGGKEIEIYINKKCPICGKETHQTVCCRFHKENTCYAHCKKCGYFRKELQKCVYKDIPREIRKFCKEKTPGK
jgi:hypothetical protein